MPSFAFLLALARRTLHDPLGFGDLVIPEPLAPHDLPTWTRERRIEGLGS